MSGEPNPAPSRIIPNAFQKPNWIADVVMRYLPGEHYKCLEVVVRKTLGWLKERDRISRSQIVELTGLNVKTVDKCMRELCVFGLTIKTAGNNAKNQGNEYALQLDDRMVDLSGLMAWSGSKRSTKTRNVPSSYKGEVSPRGGSTTTQRGEGLPTRWETQKPLSKTNRSSHTSAQNDFASMTVEQAYKVPTLAMYKRAAGFFPGQMAWAFVDGFIREHGVTEEQIKTAATAWAVRGHKQSNVEGILEWARDGVPAQRAKTKAGGKSASVKQKHDVIDGVLNNGDE
jgi:phage replication O-like protein O